MPHRFASVVTRDSAGLVQGAEFSTGGNSFCESQGCYKLNSIKRDLCVVVSHYNARPTDELVRLLYQLKQQVDGLQAQFDVKVLVVVNAVETRPLALPDDLKDTEVQYRENTGFNVGSWDHGWRNNLNFYGYLFLQDECEVLHPHALHNYWMLLKKHPNSLFGESLLFFRGWSAFLNKWPSANVSIQDFAAGRSIPLGLTASHLQTLVLAATGMTMAKLDGFILSNDKIGAIAGEVLLSRKAVSLGISVEQSQWRPFSNFSHEQWAELRQKSKRSTWNASKLLWYVVYGWRDLSIRPKP